MLLTPLRSFRFIGLLVPAAVMALAGCADPEAQAAVALPRPVMTVEAVSPQTAPWPLRLVASGEIAPWQESLIAAEIGGMRIEEVRVDVGQQVRKGQVLARFDDALLRAELAQQVAAVTQAEAADARARAEAARADSLAGSGAISQQDLMQLRTAAATSAAALELAVAQRETQALRLQRAQILAPDDGIVSARSATVGSVAMAGGELFRLIRQGRLEWRAQVRGDALAQLRPGMSAVLRRPDGGAVRGIVRSVSPLADSATRNGTVYVDLPTDSGLNGGMYLTGEFDPGSTPALFVPESALVQRDGYQYLMQIDADLRVHEVKVLTGRRRDGFVELLDGARADARYVRSGAGFAAPGALVRLASATPEAAR